MPNLDGNDQIKPTPFDAHEQLVRGVHEETGPDSPDKKDVQEYPKAVANIRREEYSAGPAHSNTHVEPVVVNSPEEEKAYHEAHEKENA